MIWRPRLFGPAYPRHPSPGAPSVREHRARGGRGSTETKHLARIHDVLGIERPLDRAHDVELGPGTVVLELVELFDADAMFRRDRAAHGGDEVVDGPCDRRGILGERIAVHALRAHEGEVHI